MTFTFMDGNYSLPDLLSDIQLDQFIGWTDLYGRDLDQQQRLLSVIENPDEVDLRRSLLYLDRIVKAFSYYSGIPLTTVQTQIDIKQVMSYMAATQISLAVEEQNIEVLPEYHFEDITYTLQPPSELQEPVTYADFMATKDLAGYMLSLAEGDWSVMPMLAAAYLRVPGESFQADAIAPDSPKVQGFQRLTMDIALGVATYLGATLQLFISTLDNYIPAEALDTYPVPTS